MLDGELVPLRRGYVDDADDAALAGLVLLADREVLAGGFHDPRVGNGAAVRRDGHAHDSGPGCLAELNHVSGGEVEIDGVPREIAIDQMLDGRVGAGGVVGAFATGGA